MGGSKMVHLWGLWGELGGWDRDWGCSAGSGCVCCHSGAASGGPGSGRARDLVIVDGDMAVEWGGSRCGTGFNRVSWGEQGGVGQLLDHSLGWWGLQDLSVKQTMHFDEHVCLSLCAQSAGL
jgi:hypothetical protein